MMKKKKGFTIVTAIFVLVILAILAVSIVNISALSQATLSNAIQGNRAFYAAKSGLEWTIFQVETNLECPANRTITLTQGGTRGFQVDVTCTKTEFLEDPELIKIFSLNSRARSGTFGEEDYVSRELVMTMYKASDIP